MNEYDRVRLVSGVRWKIKQIIEKHGECQMTEGKWIDPKVGPYKWKWNKVNDTIHFEKDNNPNALGAVSCVAQIPPELLAKWNSNNKE